MSLGKYIKAVRQHRGISQWELSRLSGLTRSHISRLELDDYENPTAETFLALSRALKVHPNELYQAAGYIDENTRFRRGPPKTAEEAVAELEIESVHIPIGTDIKQLNSGVFDVGQFATWGLNNNGHQNIKALLVRGFSMEPEIKEGDVIFIDPDTKPAPGNIILIFHNEALMLTRFRSQNNNQNPEGQYQTCGIVVGINRRLD